jgi:hypothetical protein
MQSLKKELILSQIVALLFVAVFSSSLFAMTKQLDCAEVLELQQREELSFPRLETMTDQKFSEIVGSLREQMNRQHFALIDLRDFLPEDAGELWFQTMPNERPSYYDSLSPHFKYRKDDEKIQFAASPMQVEGLLKLQDLFKRLLTEVFHGRIPLFSDGPQMRLQVVGSEGVSDNWHLDGRATRLTVTIAIHGEKGTEYLVAFPRDEMQPFPKSLLGSFLESPAFEKLTEGYVPQVAPRGFALVFFGTNERLPASMYPLIHRSAQGRGNSVLFLSRY